MPLPGKNAAWPPAEHSARYSSMATSAAWYAGDPNKLADVYGVATAPRGATGVINRFVDWFWKRPATPGDEGHKLHLPLAQDIATMSSELLFAETPRFVVQHTEFTADGTPNPAQDAAVAKTQARLDELLDNCSFGAVLLAAAETASPLGSVGLRIGYDTRNGMKMPVITRVDADAIVPEYEWGQLKAVTFWRSAVEGGTVYYHLERHERGAIYHGLYAGTSGNLGQPMALADHELTRALSELVDAEGKITTVEGALTAVSIANMLPDPLDRTSNVGRSDFSPGVLTFFDAIDRTYTSLMRDIEDGESKLIIADYMLSNNGPGKGVTFDQSQHLFTRVKMMPAEDGSNPPIEQVQFKIRVDEHLKAIDHLTSEAIKACGYSPAADNGSDGGPQTATEYSGKAKRSLSTRKKKLRYWQPIEDLLESLLLIDATFFQSGVTPFPVKMEVPEAVQPSIVELAQTVAALKQAEAASIKVRVQMLHPDWDPKQVQEEVDEIQRESSVIDPLTFGLGGAGVDMPSDEQLTVVDPADLKAKADAMGVLIRAGVEPESAAAQSGLKGVKFTGAVPTSLRLPESDASGLESGGA